MGVAVWCGADILLRRSVPESEIPLCILLHAVAVRIHLRGTYTVCSLYLAPGVEIARDDLVELLHQLPEPFFLVISISVTLLGVIRSFPRTQLCCFQ